jgi:NADH:ubiquinone oxidoreductase subunit 2 (subunit N)
MASAAVAAFFYLRLAVTMFSPVGDYGDAPAGSGDTDADDGSLAVPATDGGMASLQVLTDAPPTADVEARGPVPVPPMTAVAIGLCVAFSVVFGIFPAPILDFAHHATLLLLG